MKYIVSTTKSVTDAVRDLEAAITARQFGVLHIHDLHSTLNNKGIPFAPECQVLEVCNPQQAAKVLSADMDMNMALPCRVSVYQKGDVTHIGTLLPTAMLSALNDSAELNQVANEVEQVIVAAIDDAC